MLIVDGIPNVQYPDSLSNGHVSWSDVYFAVKMRCMDSSV